MAERNPYAPSQASLATPPVDGAGAVGVWRDGKDLVMSMSATLPHRCVKCNELSVDPTKARKVYWHHPGLYALILLNLLLYAIVAAIVRKKAVIDPGLCAEHKKKRSRVLLTCWMGVLGAIAAFFAVALEALDPSWGSSIAAILIIAAIVGGIVFGRIVYPTRIDKEYVRLRGCGADFLDSLPAFRG